MTWSTRNWPSTSTTTPTGKNSRSCLCERPTACTNLALSASESTATKTRFRSRWAAATCQSTSSLTSTRPSSLRDSSARTQCARSLTGSLYRRLSKVATAIRPCRPALLLHPSALARRLLSEQPTSGEGLQSKISRRGRKEKTKRRSGGMYGMRGVVPR